MDQQTPKRSRPNPSRNASPPTEASPALDLKAPTYQMRKGLQFHMETPKFIHDFRNQLSGHAAPAISNRDPGVDDDGPLIVMESSLTMTTSDMDELRRMHPRSNLEEDLPATPNVPQPTRGAPVDQVSGKLLFQSKPAIPNSAGAVLQMSSKRTKDSKISSTKRPKKKADHLLSFDE